MKLRVLVAVAAALLWACFSLPSQSEFSLPVTIVGTPSTAPNETELEQSRRDLAAQESMARSANTMIWLGFLQTALTVAGTGGLFYTVYLTRKSTKAATDAAKAAVEAKNLERAWITFADYQAIRVSNTHEGDFLIVDGLGFELIWQNSGRTPALNIKSHTDHEIVDAQPGTSNLTANPELDDSSGTLGPNSKFRTGIILLSDGETEMMRSGKYKLIVACAFSYEDVFNPGIRHHSSTKLAFYYNGEQEINGRTLLRFAVTPQSSMLS